MKLLKSIAMISMATLFAFNQVQAAEPKQPQNPLLGKSMSEADLKQFNNNFGIRLTQRTNAVDTNTNQPVAIFTFEVENKGKKVVKSATWVSVLNINNQPFYAQEIKADFPKPLKPKAKETVHLQIPFSSVPEQVQQIFANKDAPIGSLFVAKELVFTKGKAISVK